MISLSEPTATSRYVYFDATGVITSITGRLSEETTDSFAPFEIEDVKDLITGDKRMIDYSVVRTSNPLIFEIVKKHVNVKTRNIKNQISKILENENETDINVELVDDGLIFYASNDLILKTNVSAGQNVKIAGTSHHPFFITCKDRPDFLLKLLVVDFSELLSGEKLKINYEHKYDISVYTKEYFDTYSLRRA